MAGESGKRTGRHDVGIADHRDGSHGAEMVVVVMTQSGRSRTTSLLDLTKAGSIYGDTVKVFDPGWFLKMFFDGLVRIDPGLEVGSLGPAAEIIERWIANMDDFDGSIIDQLQDRQIISVVDLARIVVDTVSGQGSMLDDSVGSMYIRALDLPRSYAMLDRHTAPTVTRLLTSGQLFPSPAARRRAKSASTAGEILGKIPSFKAADIDDVLGIRSELRPYLPAFRSAMNRLAQTFESDANQASFFDEVEEAWVAMVEPALEELRSIVDENRFLRHLALAGSTNADPLVGSGIGIAAALATGQPLLGIVSGLAASTTSAVVRASAASSAAATTTRKNEFFFLHELDELLGV